MKTSEKIAKARNDANLTQDQLAELLQVSRQTVSKWELDISLPETAKLSRLSGVLGVSIDYLLSEEDTGPNVKVPMKQGQSGFEPDWTELYPILKQYEAEVDCQHYIDRLGGLLDEVQSRYHYTAENAMLVVKDLLAKTYFKRLG